MSNKLAKVLLICALIVCIPMFIAGTVLAVYFSKDASFDVAVYIDNAGRQYGDTATPTITSNAKSLTSNLDEETAQFDLYTVTNCHVEDITLSYEATGYDFVGWFEGSYEDYTHALSSGEDITYISNNATLTTKTANYTNLTAVFNVIVYNVDFSEESVTDATYEYNQELPTFSNGTDIFLGWFISGDTTETTYTRANFPTENRNVVLNPNFEDIALHTFTVNYVDENGDELTFNTLIDTMLDSYTLISTDDYQASRQGYTLSWVDKDGNVVTEITSDMLVKDGSGNPQPITLTLNKEVINTTVNVIVPENVTYTGETQFVVNIENKDSDPAFTGLFSPTSWQHEIYPLSWEFAGVTVGSQEFDSSAKLWTHILTNNLTTIDVTGVVTPKFSSLQVNRLDFIVETGMASPVYYYYEDGGYYVDLATVRTGYYVDLESSVQDYLYTASNNGSSAETAVGLFYNFNFNADTTYYMDNNGETEVAPTRFTIVYNSLEGNPIATSLDMSVYDLVEAIASLMGSIPEGHGQSLTIDSISLVFEEV